MHVYSKLTCQILYTEEKNTCEKIGSLASTVDVVLHVSCCNSFGSKAYSFKGFYFWTLFLLRQVCFHGRTTTLVSTSAASIVQDDTRLFLWMFFCCMC